MANKIHAKQIDTAAGAFFAGGASEVGAALRHPNRVFIGDAYAHGQETDGSVTGGSWLQSFDVGARTVTGWDYFEDMARDVAVTSIGIARSAVARTSGGSGVDGIGTVGVVLNNRTGTQQGWGGYFEGVRAAAAGTTVGAEFEAVNLGTSAMGGFTPYRSLVDGMTRSIALAAGGDEAVWGRSYAADAAATVSNNGAAFWAGLVFRFDALMREGGTDDTTSPGNSGFARAVVMGHDQGLSWYSRDPSGSVGSGTQEEVLRLYSSVDDDAIRWNTVFDDTGFRVQQGHSAPVSLFDVDYLATPANYLAAVPAATGSYVELAARGTDTNIDLRLRPKGSGVLRFSYAAGAAGTPGSFSANRRIAVKDGTGTTVYIAASTTAW